MKKLSKTYIIYSLRNLNINPNRKVKTPFLEDNLVIIKDPKKDACVSVNSVKQGLKRDTHTTL